MKPAWWGGRVAAYWIPLPLSVGSEEDFQTDVDEDLMKPFRC